MKYKKMLYTLRRFFFRRVIEFVDHLHEHFVDPVILDNGKYKVPMVCMFLWNVLRYVTIN